MLHGTRDLTTNPRASTRFVVRAALLTRHTACVQVPWSGHGMLLRAGLWHHLTAEFVSAVVDDAPFTDALADARAARCIDCTPEAAA